MRAAAGPAERGGCRARGGEADLVIGFSNADDTTELAGGVIGVGGSLRQGADASTGRAKSLRGFALIDLTNLYRDGPKGPATLRNIKATATHEIGHMMGLGHVDTKPSGGGLGGFFPTTVIRDQLMFPALSQTGNFDVFDNGVGFNPLSNDGVGLANIHERLHLLFGRDAELVIESPPGGGTRASIRLPYQMMENA